VALRCCFQLLWWRSHRLVWGTALVLVWKAEHPLWCVPGTWAADPSASLGRDLGVNVWSLFSSVDAYGWRFTSWIRVKVLSPVVARANGVDALGRRFLLGGDIVVKLLSLP
jgi:hypothetical protein